MMNDSPSLRLWRGKQVTTKVGNHIGKTEAHNRSPRRKKGKVIIKKFRAGLASMKSWIWRLCLARIER